MRLVPVCLTRSTLASVVSPLRRAELIEDAMSSWTSGQRVFAALWVSSKLRCSMLGTAGFGCFWRALAALLDRTAVHCPCAGVVATVAYDLLG